ncbi:hypothetical protein Taro_024417 [Colocasia esculenta]|uniref:Uncharacterized protein n=1 Tax=Colocasia esculenta TaxID=4460 RepID=A0A843V6A0_COLES|nr:hypothetical protein [Colocasia esculenta]
MATAHTTSPTARASWAQENEREHNSKQKQYKTVLGETSTRTTKAPFWGNSPERTSQPTAHLNPEGNKTKMSMKKFWEKPLPEQARKSSGNTSPELTTKQHRATKQTQQVTQHTTNAITSTHRAPAKSEQQCRLSGTQGTHNSPKR